MEASNIMVRQLLGVVAVLLCICETGSALDSPVSSQGLRIKNEVSAVNIEANSQKDPPPVASAHDDPVKNDRARGVPTSREQPDEGSQGVTNEEIAEILSKVNATMGNIRDASERSHEKDWWDKFDLITKFVATVLLVALGGIFTYFYRSAQDKHEEELRIQQERVHKLDVVSKFMPFISSEREEVRQTAIFAVQDLVGTEAAVKLALIKVSPDTPTTLQVLGERAAAKDRNVATVALDEVVRSGDFTLIESLYVTDRNVLDNSTVRFGTGRANLSFGIATVSIPRTHRLGSIESPSALRLEFREDPAKHVVMTNASILTEQAFIDTLTRKLASTEGAGIVIFVHDFNVSFSYAARSFTQSFFDLNLHAVPILYSWPTSESVTGYLQDDVNVTWTAAHLTTFLLEIKKIIGDAKLSLIADGLGCKAILDAVQTLPKFEGSAHKPFLDQIIFAAPDVDEDVFRAQAATLTSIARRVTRYVSSQDKVLMASRNLHGSARAGLSDPSTPEVPDIDTVDVSGVDTSSLGHDYFAGSGSLGSVLLDLRGVLQGVPANERIGLKQMSKSGSRTWKLL
jgi:esterase/lipase superfamily enzyme